MRAGIRSLMCVTGRSPVSTSSIFLASLALASLVLTSCGAPTPDICTDLGRRMILDQVDMALTTEDCATAVELIEPVYQSSCSTNEVRVKAASAYACHAKINYFRLVGDVASNAGNLAGATFWNTMSRFFYPSTGGEDYVAEGAVLATDALMSALKPGALVLPINQINPGTFNVGSVFTFDRVNDANIYLVFTAMAGIGGFQNRYGSPNVSTSYSRGALLPWTTAATVTTDGCAYASSILNFVDAIGAVKDLVPDELSGTLESIEATFSSGFNVACNLGCLGTTSANIDAALPTYNSQGNWVTAGTGCAIAAGCASCPTALRNRNNCTKATTDEASCAAAGLVNFVNSAQLGWQP